MDKIPELLAPAASRNAALEAFQAGADAVYLGVPRLNARLRAANLSLHELRELLPQAHKMGKKIYLTLNTLVKPQEWPQLRQIAQFSLIFGVDALIIQDWGVLRYLRDLYPELPIHASTQMFTYHLAALQELKEQGVQRVILPRELSRGEVAWLASRSPLDLEIFVHGALCFSFSGACWISELFYGDSGNRGLCRQICRHPFQTRQGTIRPFALKDLDNHLHLDEFARLGIVSLKIEGRLRSLSYLRETVTMYRRLLDGEKFQPRFRFSRPGTDGYWRGETGDSLLASSDDNQLGEYVGIVKNGWGRELIIQAGETPSIGASLRLVAENGRFSSNVTVIFSEQIGKNIQRLKTDKNMDRILPQSLVYLTNDPRADLLMKAAVSPDVRLKGESEINLRIIQEIGKLQVYGRFVFPRLAPLDVVAIVNTVEEPLVAECDAQILQQVWGQTGNYPWRVNSVELHVTQNFGYRFWKRTRRELFQQFHIQWQHYQREQLRRIEPVAFSSTISAPVFQLRELFNIPNDFTVTSNDTFLGSQILATQLLERGMEPGRLWVRLPLFFSPLHEEDFKIKMEEWVRKGCNLCLTHWGQIPMARSLNIKWIGYYTLNCINPLMEKWLSSQGMSGIVIRPLAPVVEPRRAVLLDTSRVLAMIYRPDVSPCELGYNGRTLYVEKEDEAHLLWAGL